MKKRPQNEEFIEILSLSNEELATLRSKNIDFSPTGTYSEPALRNLWLAVQDESQPLDSENLAQDLIKLLEKQVNINFPEILLPQTGVTHPHLSKSSQTNLSWVEQFWSSKGQIKQDYPREEKLKEFSNFLYKAIHEAEYQTRLKNNDLQQAYKEFLLKKTPENTTVSFEYWDEFVQEQIKLLREEIDRNPSNKSILESKVKSLTLYSSMEIQKQLGLVSFIYPLLNESLADVEKRTLIKKHFEAWILVLDEASQKDIKRSDYFIADSNDNLGKFARSENALQDIHNIPQWIQQFCKWNFNQEGVASFLRLTADTYTVHEGKKVIKNGDIPELFNEGIKYQYKYKPTSCQYNFVFEEEKLKKIIFTYALYRNSNDEHQDREAHRLIWSQTFEFPEGVSEAEANAQYYPGTFPTFNSSFHIYMNKDDVEQDDYPDSFADFVNLLNKEAKKDFRLEKELLPEDKVLEKASVPTEDISVQKKLLDNYKKSVFTAGFIGAFLGVGALISVSLLVPTVAAFIVSLAFPPLGLAFLALGIGLAAAVLGAAIIGGITAVIQQILIKEKLSYSLPKPEIITFEPSLPKKNDIPLSEKKALKTIKVQDPKFPDVNPEQQKEFNLVYRVISLDTEAAAIPIIPKLEFQNQNELDEEFSENFKENIENPSKSQTETTSSTSSSDASPEITPRKQSNSFDPTLEITQTFSYPPTIQNNQNPHLLPSFDEAELKKDSTFKL